ncbi:hypothetical protein [Flavobacterium sp. 7A]|uniref:hypothetical protein n=1 Tax=Flavobacterium sp. 7A TaxID=2940571 RepID=UPI002226ABCD|nr:hypothetical protein [Flavobacterium sp. 7A]MCW2119866.1 vacuolar-type H+-ATPase subunit I/STV1 [Flavobacterium sp. 7A]
MMKKGIVTFILLVMSIVTYGQKKTPFLQNIRSYIITDSDTIKIQRYNGTEYHKLVALTNSPYEVNNYAVAVAVISIEAYLDARSSGQIQDNPNEIERRFNNLTNIAKSYKLTFNIENYRKEASYYKTKEDKETERIKEHNDLVKKNAEIEKQRIDKIYKEKKQSDSIYYVELKQKAKNDSIQYVNQKKINDLVEKEQRKKDAIKQIAINKKQKKQEIEIKTTRKLENEKRRNLIINKYGKENGEAILNHKVKIGWTKSMCIASWGKPYDINRTTNAYGTQEQYVYSLKKYLYFENGILTGIQD